MTAKGTRIAIATLCGALAACGTQAPQSHPTSSLNRLPPPPQICRVSVQSCLSMNPEPPRPCLASPERCAGHAEVQRVDASAGSGP